MIRDYLRNRFGQLSKPTGNRQTASADLFKKTYGAIKPARIGPADSAMSLLGPKDERNILYPLFETKGIQFPYTPDVTFGGQAEYQDFHFTHSNYAYHNFSKSMPSEIQVQGTFTCQTNEEGKYLLATLRFLRAMSMMEFGFASAYREDNRAGTPPPVLRFNYLGEYMFSNVPVIINNFSFTLPRDVDYVGVRYRGGIGFAADPTEIMERAASKGGQAFSRDQIIGGPDAPISHVPTRMDLMVTLKVQQNPNKVRTEFDLETFRQGGLVKKGFV